MQSNKILISHCSNFTIEFLMLNNNVTAEHTHTPNIF
jgi:hypothetical protein